MKIERKKEIGKIKIHHNKILFWIIIALLLVLIGMLIYIRTHPNEGGNSQLANPASVYCVENGGELDIRNDANGGQYGVCILKNGTECDEWKYYRQEC